MAKKEYKTVDEYIATFPEDIQEILQRIRSTIAKAAPQAEETISYQMPTFKLKKNLVHFAAFEKHIGFYPTPSGIAAFTREFEEKGYPWAKGSVQFPLEEIPYDLISRITKYRVTENHEKQRKTS